MSYKPTSQVRDSDVAQELDAISREFASQLLYLRKFTSAPRNPIDGLAVICDGVLWNPLGDGIKRPVWFDADASIWKTFA